MDREQYELAVFDWNGTLLDDSWVMAAVMERVFAHYGVPSPGWDVYRREMRADSGASIANFYHCYGVPETENLETLNTIRDEVLREKQGEAHLAMGARELLVQCAARWIPTALVSAESPDILVARLHDEDLFKLFCHAWGGIYDKENALRIVCREEDVPPHHAVYVDDTDAGIGAAKRAGMKTIGVTGGYNTPERLVRAGADHLVTGVAELVEG